MCVNKNKGVQECLPDLQCVVTGWNGSIDEGAVVSYEARSKFQTAIPAVALSVVRTSLSVSITTAIASESLGDVSKRYITIGVIMIE